jgi:choline monooxygenase
MNLTELSDGASLEATRLPLNHACNLPSVCYTSPAWYERELEHIFLKEWICLGHASQVPRPGDYFTLTFAGEPLLIVRGDDRQIRAFVNVCRHRASPVASGDGNCRAFVCPYHRWTYDRQGRLLATPGRRNPMNEAVGFDPTANGLIAARLETWGGFLFVTFDPGSPALRSWLGDLPTILRNYPLEEMVVTRRMSWTVDVNWKVFMENSIEEYHLETLHQKHLPADNPNLVVIEQARGPFTLRYTPVSITVKGSPFPPLEGLSEKERAGTYPLALFPNTNMIVGNHFVKLLQHMPESLERCMMTMSFLFPPAVLERPEFPAYAEQAYRYTQELLDEDTSISPRVQQGLRSRFRRPGRFSKQEGGVHAFQNYVLRRVLDADGKGAKPGCP